MEKLLWTRSNQVPKFASFMLFWMFEMREKQNFPLWDKRRTGLSNSSIHTHIRDILYPP